ncbi:MAG: beta-lactamase family protein [Cyclobacteriaceae bacterium]|nr:serine hydrolase [Cyclobacteriaceae bacterium]MCH8516396.1 beta-lactamase family protein [Cyclobacteriaceae bacterium]
MEYNISFYQSIKKPTESIYELMTIKKPISIFLSILLMAMVSCRSDEEVGKPIDETVAFYFPHPNETWETFDFSSVCWNEDSLQPLHNLAVKSDSRAVLLLRKGRIVYENYAGSNLVGGGSFGKDSNWYWASAGKVLLAFAIGIAEADGLINIDDPIGDYLGAGWSSMNAERELAISTRHLLSMVSGLEDEVKNINSTQPADLRFREVPEQRWAYHNGAYNLIQRILDVVSGSSFEEYVATQIFQPLNMNARWLPLQENTVCFSSARDMAKFGMMMQAGARWNDMYFNINDSYFQQMISSSQDLNPNYGYLWWLNEADQFKLPQVNFTFNGHPVTNGPRDLKMALGLNGQILMYSEEMDFVFVRMGEMNNDPISIELVNRFMDAITESIACELY